MPDEMRIDSDGDGLSDAVERQLGTNVHKADSDGDGLSDGFEVAVGNHPRVRDLSVKDPAGSAAIVDDLVRGHEQLTGVTEHNVDSDGDGFADWVESMRGGTSTTAADLTANAVVPNPSPLDEFLNRAQSQAGVPYRFGAEADLDNPSGADAFDSSELVQWAAHQAGVDLPDGSWMQYRSLALAGPRQSRSSRRRPRRGRCCSASRPTRWRRRTVPPAPSSASASATARCSTSPNGPVRCASSTPAASTPTRRRSPVSTRTSGRTPTVTATRTSTSTSRR